MSKAILVVDMPESCDMCNFAEMVNRKMYCLVPGCGKLAEDYIVCRPDWCPLRELPEEKESDPVMDCDIDFGIAEGWNACIDEIMKGSEEHE